MGKARRMIRVIPAVVLALLLLAVQAVGAAPAHAASTPQHVIPNTCFWPADASYSNNITLNGTVVGNYEALVEHDTCNTSLHRGEALITFSSSKAGCNNGTFHFEFDKNGSTQEISSPDPFGTVGMLGIGSCTDGATLDYVGGDYLGSAAYCTEMTSVSWFQAWPNIQAGSQCRPL
jgi:hypothetical protein